MSCKQYNDALTRYIYTWFADGFLFMRPFYTLPSYICAYILYIKTDSMSIIWMIKKILAIKDVGSIQMKPLGVFVKE